MTREELVIKIMSALHRSNSTHSVFLLRG